MTIPTSDPWNELGEVDPYDELGEFDSYENYDGAGDLDGAGGLQELTGMALHVLSPHGPRSEPSGEHIGSRVTIRGHETFDLMLRCDLAHARDLAADMIGVPSAEVGVHEAADVLGELANTLAGLTKTLIPGECDIGLPQVVMGEIEGPNLGPTAVVPHGVGLIEVWVTANDG